MQQELFVALLAGLGGMLGWGVADFFAKKTIDAIGDVTTLFWSQLLGVVPLAILFVISPSHVAFSPMEWAMLIGLGVWSGLSYIPTYVAFGKGQVSLLSPIFASYAVVVAVLSAVLMHEQIPFGRRVAFAVVFGGVLLISGDPRRIWNFMRGKKGNSRGGVPGLKEILLAICLYSVWLIALDRVVSGQYWVPYLLVIRLFSAISLFSYCRATGRKVGVAKPAVWKFLILVGCFDVAASGSVAFGFSATSYASVVAMLSGAFSLPTMVLARVFLREQATALQTVGSVVTVVGIMLLAVL